MKQMRSGLIRWVGVVIVAMLLGACAPAATPTPAPTVAPKPAVPPTVAPTAAPKPAAPAAPTTAPAAPKPTVAPAAPTTAAKPAAAEKVEYVQASDSPNYSYAYAAIGRGFIKEQNIQMEPPIISGSSASTVQAVTVGAGAIGAVSSDSAILAIDKKAPLKIIAAGTLMPPYALMVRPEVNSAADLKGANCGASNLVSGESPFLKAMIKNKYGLTYPNDYGLLVIGSRTDRNAGLIGGAVKCIATGAPENLELADRGMKEVASAAKGDAFPDYNFLALIVNTDWAAQHRSAIVRTLKAFNQGMEWMFTNYDKPEAVPFAISPGKDPGKYGGAALRIYYGPPGTVQARQLKPSLKGLTTVIDYMKQDGTFPKDEKPDWKKYLDMSYWEEATGQKFEY